LVKDAEISSSQVMMAVKDEAILAFEKSLNLNKMRIQSDCFSEITKNAITKAIEEIQNNRIISSQLRSKRENSRSIGVFELPNPLEKK